MHKENIGDLKLKYRQCYVVIKPKGGGENNILTISDFSKHNGEDFKVHGSIVSLEDREHEDVTFKYSEISPLIPIPTGCINTDKTFIVLNEVMRAGRGSQYKRLPCSHTLQLEDPFNTERELLMSPKHRLSDGSTLLSIANSRYLDPMEALESVISFKRLGAAFTSEYGFGIKFNPDAVILFKRHFMVGRVDIETMDILLKPKVIQLAEELEEFGFNIKVV